VERQYDRVIAESRHTLELDPEERDVIAAKGF
jgi:hypothetical protein